MLRGPGARGGGGDGGWIEWLLQKPLRDTYLSALWLWRRGQSPRNGLQDIPGHILVFPVAREHVGTGESQSWSLGGSAGLSCGSVQEPGAGVLELSEP